MPSIRYNISGYCNVCVEFELSDQLLHMKIFFELRQFVSSCLFTK